MDAVLTYYAHHGSITDPREQGDLFADLPDDVEALCTIVDGLVIHPIGAQFCDIQLPDEQLHDQTIRPIDRTLARIREHDPRPLDVERPLHERSAKQCYGFATLLCALLRHHSVPARVRSGFASYLASPDLVYNHWLCEYWNKNEQRWVLLEPDLGTAQHVGINPYDVPRTEFQTAAEIWQLCRAGHADPQRFGYDEVRGFGYIGCQLVHDMACLNKAELLATDRWGLMDDTVKEYGSDTNQLLDHVAALAVAGNDTIEELHHLYKHDARLRAPDAVINGQ